MKPKNKVSVLKDGYLSDLVKISQQMKSNLEGMVLLGLESPAAFGILAKGMEVSLLVMDIDHEATYRLYEYASVKLISSLVEFSNIPTIIRSFLGYKTMVMEVIEAIEALELSKSKGTRIKRSVSLKYIRTGQFTTKRTKKN